MKYSEASGSHEGRPETTRSQEWRPGRYDGAVDAGVAPQRYYYHFDGLGSVAALSNAAGELVETYEYDVYGDTTVKDTAGTILTKSSIGNPYGFTGRRVDVETGLYYYRARYYDVDTGRFLSVDPLGYKDSMNLYAYCLNNPVNRIDPYGETTQVIFLGITIVVAFVILGLFQVTNKDACNKIISQFYDWRVIGSTTPPVQEANQKEEKKRKEKEKEQKENKPPGNDKVWDPERSRWVDDEWVYTWDPRPHDKRGKGSHWDRGRKDGKGKGEWSPNGIDWFKKKK